MITQKQVKLIGVRVQNHRNIVATLLTPEILSKDVIKLVGVEGSGKTSELDAITTAFAGNDAIKSKSSLLPGYLSEVQLSDGDHKIFLGARMAVIGRGDNKGESKFETFLFEKGADGKEKDVMMDGHKWTAAEYQKEITTNLIFSLPKLFSKVWSEHNELIEGLFAPELNKLGIKEKVAEILAAKEKRDSARDYCSRLGAFKENFDDEGLNLDDLAVLVEVDLDSLQGEMTKLEVAKGSLVSNATTQTELNKSQAQSVRDLELQKIKDKAGRDVTAMRELADKISGEYRLSLATFNEKSSKVGSATESLNETLEEVRHLPFVSDGTYLDVKNILDNSYGEYKKLNDSGICPIQPILPTFSTDGIPTIPENVSPEFEPYIKSRNTLLLEYSTLKESELIFETVNPENTSEYDKKIADKKAEIDRARINNKNYDRYTTWADWIDKKNLYESRIDELRRLYASVNTGVDGLRIVPTEESGRVRCWMEYNGVYDKGFFGNTTGESRRLFEYSGAQMGIIAVLLQAARLDLKDKALRLVILQAVPMTSKGLAILAKVCDEKKVQLITDQTDEHYDLNSLDDSTVVMENGEVFFNK